MVCPHGQLGGLANADILRTRAETLRGVNFSRFCVDVFYGRPPTMSSWDWFCLSFIVL